MSCAFWGDNEDEPYFKSILNEVALTNPGIVLLGENVDVDVDEPSIGIRWSVLGCGDGYILNGSAGVHESNSCGLPAMYLQIYVDNSVQPTAIYDPSQLPFVSETGRRRNIQNLVQFDSDHTLDVHLDRLYPFDTYLLTATLHATDISGSAVPIQKLATIDQMSSFQIGCSDMASYEVFNASMNGTRLESRGMDLNVQRPGQARAFALALFGLSWMLTHATVAFVYVARKHEEAVLVIRYIALALAILLVIPQLRNAMPDAPGYDGVLIDCIGFFPQMILTSVSVVAMVLLIILREFNHLSQGIVDKSKVSVDIALSSAIPPPPLPHPRPKQSSIPLKHLILGTKKRTTSVILEHGRLSDEEYLLGEKHGQHTSQPQRDLQGYAFPPRRYQHLRSRSSRTAIVGNESCGFSEPVRSSSGRPMKKHV